VQQAQGRRAEAHVLASGAWSVFVVCCDIARSQLPRTLLVHEKRFEFDLDLVRRCGVTSLEGVCCDRTCAQMKRIKVNDSFDFPRRLDLSQYTLEGAYCCARAHSDGVIVRMHICLSRQVCNDARRSNGTAPTRAWRCRLCRIRPGACPCLDTDVAAISRAHCAPHSYYQFRLRGVLVHAGNAESGHYYSLIRCVAW
jgi:hypothetical protein